MAPEVFQEIGYDCVAVRKYFLVLTFSIVIECQ